MNKVLNIAPLVLLLVFLCTIGHAQSTKASEQKQRKAGDLTLTPYNLQSEGQSIAAELGRLVVKENRKNPNSNLIELAFVRLRSTAAEPGYPVVYLDGGPGSSAINLARIPTYTTVFQKLREAGDVILLDQRGVGLSKPNLSRLSAQGLPLDSFESKENAMRVFKQRVKEVADHFKAQGVDILSYNTVESASDIEDLRKALGAEKLNLVGFSYGTHLGLAAIRQHGPHLNRVVLIGTEGPDHTHKLPRTAHRSIERLARLAAADPEIGPKVPDLVGSLRRTLDRLEREPVSVQITDRRTRQKVDVKVGKFALQILIMMDLGDTSDLPVFPAWFYTMEKGDYSILARFVEKRFNQFGAGMSLMPMVMDGSSGVTRARAEQIKREAKDSLLGDAMNFPFPEVGEAFGSPDLGDKYRSPIRTDVQTLFISGTLDNNTPPFQADEVRKTFKNSLHLIVENAGHESMLDDAQVQQVIIDYLRGRDVSKVKLALPPLRFVAIPDVKPAAQWQRLE
jgi:pimeloyl-ACP methyl ester carboxylesterase